MSTGPSALFHDDLASLADGAEQAAVAAPVVFAQMLQIGNNAMTAMVNTDLFS